MTKFADLVPERIKALGGYSAGKPIKQAEAESGVKCIKLASNENPFGPSPLALEAMRAAAAEVNLYPDNDVTELKNRVAELNNMSADQVMITGGSTSFLDIIARTLLGPGLNAITSERTFIVYSIFTKAAGAEFRQVPMKDDTFDLDAIAEAIDDNTRVIYLANPNNPTGTLVDAAAVDRFLSRVPDHVCVVFDEAYYEYAEYFAKRRGVEYSRTLDYVRQGRNVVVLRTFSKIQGLAAVRVGYGFAPAELLSYFARVRTVFMVTSVGEAGAVAGLDDEAHRHRALENNAAGEKFLMSKLQDMGYHPIQTWGNFIYCEVGEDSIALAKRMQEAGVIIRPLAGPWGARTAIRVTIGTPEQNEIFVAALKKVTTGAVATK